MKKQTTLKNKAKIFYTCFISISLLFLVPILSFAELSKIEKSIEINFELIDFVQKKGHVRNISNDVVSKDGDLLLAVKVKNTSNTKQTFMMLFNPSREIYPIPLEESDIDPLNFYHTLDSSLIDRAIQGYELFVSNGLDDIGDPEYKKQEPWYINEFTYLWYKNLAPNQTYIYYYYVPSTSYINGFKKPPVKITTPSIQINYALVGRDNNNFVQQIFNQEVDSSFDNYNAILSSEDMYKGLKKLNYNFNTKSVSLENTIPKLDLQNNEENNKNSNHKTIFTLGKKEYIINGHKKNLSVAPYSRNSRVMLPVRVLGDAIDLKVSWNPHTKIATFSNSKKSVKINVNLSTMNIDGRDVKLNIKPEIKNGVIFVELKSLSEAFGVDIKWISSEKSVIIEK